MIYKIRILLLIFMLNSAWLFGNDPANIDCSSYYTWESVGGTNTMIRFSNQSTGTFNTWTWSFGDGTTSAVFNPVHEFNAVGTYYVCLTISDGGSCNDVYCDTVEVIPECQADFDFTYVPTTPIYIQFSDLSTGYPDTWLWLFGDGTSSTSQNPVHPYYEPGNYEVCLIIHHDDSLYSCTDSICQTVIIPDSLNCEASYIFDIDPDDPLKIHFFDQSTGNITDWEWNFGDGTISNEQNPVHIFSVPSEYMVCLRVENSDSVENCVHFICETIILEDSIQCEADFFTVADSSSNVMYRYSFFDQSIGNPDQWLWNFGDGNLSHEQNPIHAYDEPGTYEICLNTWNSNHPGCNDSYCGLVQTSNYFHLGGLAFIGDNPINNPYPAGDTGIAILYRQRNDHKLIAVDTNVFYEYGYYWFSNMMEMDYMVRICLSPGSEHYNEFTPSYFPGVMRWQEADAFILFDDMYEMNTSLMEAYGADPGQGRISGRVLSGSKHGFDSHASFHDVPVILTDESSTPLEWTTTNEYGQFVFNSIALGSYLLYADVAGIYSQPELVVLNEGYPINDTVRIKMYEGSSPFTVEEQNESPINLAALYPNPVINKVTLKLTAEKPLLLTLNVLNMTGQVIYRDSRLVTQGSNNIEVPAENMPAGIYMISLRWDGQKQLVSKKFIKN